MTPRNRHERRAAAKKAQQEAAASSDPRLKGLEIRYGGRTVQVTSYVNTDEPLEHVVARIQKAAQGPKLHMVAVLGGMVDDDAAQAVWETAFPVVVEAAKKQN